MNLNLKIENKISSFYLWRIIFNNFSLNTNLNPNEQSVDLDELNFKMES